MKDFFVSYNHNDRHWAEWIALTLTQSNHTVTIQVWDFLPGANFVLEMHKAILECKRTVAVLSPDWLASVFTQPEWAAAFALDPTGVDRKLIPVRVRPCEPPGLLRALIYCDLVGLGESDARKSLIDSVREVPSRPDAVAFPGAIQTTQPPRHSRPESSPAVFPGMTSSLPLDRLPVLVKCALDLLALLRTTRTTFDAQARLRDDLERRVSERLVLYPYHHYEYEGFCAKYHSQLNDDERRVFATVRSFTATVLHAYNRKMLETIDRCPGLGNHIPSAGKLKDHLLLWLAKFDGVFLNTPTMCLLYVGVDEQVPFPQRIELETWDFLERQGETQGLLRQEPDPPSEFTEHASSDSYWRMSLHDKWLLKQISELEQERRTITTGSDAPSAHDTTLKDIDERLATVLKESLFPGMLLEKLVEPTTLCSLLQDVVASRKEQWPAELIAATNAVQSALGLSPFFWVFRDVLPLLPTVAFYAGQFGIAKEMDTEWQGIRKRLTEDVVSFRSRKLNRN
jgi:hypothetical protein